MDVIVGIGIVPFFLCAPVNGVAFHVANHVFGIVEEPVLDVSLGQPSPCPAINGGLRLVESAHVAESGGGAVEVALEKLRAAHEHPGLPKKGIVLLATEPFQVALGLAALLVPLRPTLDGVQLDGFLGLLDGLVKATLTQFAALLVGHGVERDELGVVILVAVFLGQRAVYVGQRTIIIGVVSGIERVPPPRLCRILLGGTAGQCQDHACHGQKK